MNTIKHLYGLARILNDIQIDTETNPIKLKAVDIELDFSDYNHLEYELHSNSKAFEFRYIKPTISLENGRVRGYIRLFIDHFTFNIFLKKEANDIHFKELKPHSRYY